MLSWIVRILMLAAGSVAGWFAAKDSAAFGIVQMAVAVILLALIVAVLAFWPAHWTERLDGPRKQR